MARAVNDATLQKAGDIYQYLIALRDCFELNDGDTLQIETNGDVSIIKDVGGRFQREVKHHFGNTSISDRDIDFWKTLANWYVDYERVKNFSNYILSTTATIKSDSPFHSWNNIKKTEKLKCLKDIGATSKKTEETFRNVMDWNLESITKRDVRVSDEVIEIMKRWNDEYLDVPASEGKAEEPSEEELVQIEKFKKNGWI